MSALMRFVSLKFRGCVRRLANVAYVGQAGLAGLKLRDVHAVRAYDLLRDLEARYHLSIRTVLYIGANQGQDVPALLLAYPWATIHCFEPQSTCQGSLQSLARKFPGRVHVHAVALSDREGTATLRRPTDHDQASSLLTPNEEMAKRFPHVNNWEEEEVVATTLDKWCELHEIAVDILVKMDVQGAEHLVLKGGAGAFDRARLVICEMAVVPTYRAAPDMRSMFEALQQLGFGYAGEVAQVRDTQAVVVEFDGAFVRPRPAVLGSSQSNSTMPPKNG